jgi:hypothetical protein
MVDTARLARPDLSTRVFHLPGHLYAYVASDPTNLVDPRGLAFDDLKSEEALAAFQAEHGGSTQGTLALIRTTDGQHYMIEQQTNNRIKDVAEGRGITYLPQGRLSGFHAEMRFIKDGEAQSITLEGAEIWVSKPICGDCAKTLRAKGLTIMTSTMRKRYRNWLSPDTTARTVPRSGRGFQGRRSEVQRLQESLPKDFNSRPQKRQRTG